MEAITTARWVGPTFRDVSTHAEVVPCYNGATVGPGTKIAVHSFEGSHSLGAYAQ